METIAVLRERGRMSVADRNMGLGKDWREITKELVERLIENEIDAAFFFLDVARNDFRAETFSDGDAALSKAEAIYLQASELAREGSGGNSNQAIADSLRELRSTIDVVKSDRRW